MLPYLVDLESPFEAEVPRTYDPVDLVRYALGATDSLAEAVFVQRPGEKFATLIHSDAGWETGSAAERRCRPGPSCVGHTAIPTHRPSPSGVSCATYLTHPSGSRLW